MDKTGIGDLALWGRLNFLAKIVFYGVALIWLSTAFLTEIRKLTGSSLFSQSLIQLAIGVALII